MPFCREVNTSKALPIAPGKHFFSSASPAQSMPRTRIALRAILFPVMVAAILLIASGGIMTALAQEPPREASPSPAGQRPPDQAPKPSVPPKPIALYNLLQKKSIVFPDIAYSTERLSVGEKFKLFVDNSVSVNTVSWSLLGSAVGQANDSPSGFEQGWGAYGKRFGSSMARSASTEFFGTFMIASALHQDPRFYAEINPTLVHAMKYSVQRVFVMQNDDGRTVVAWTRLGGPLLAEGLANVYWPDRNRTVGDTFLRYGLDLASRAGGNMLREYWPVLLEKMSHSPRPAAGHN